MQKESDIYRGLPVYKMVTMIRSSLKKCREGYLTEEYFQRIEQHYVTGVHF